MVGYKKQKYRMKRKIKKKTALSKGIQNSFRMFRAKIQGYLSVLPDTAVSQFDYKNSYPLNFPGSYRNNGGVYGPILNSTGPLFLTAISNMLTRLMDTFDMYQVQSLNVRFMPFADKVYTPTTQDNTAAFSSTLSYVKDLDDSALISTNQIALNNGAIPRGMNRASSITYVQPKIGRSQWFNCQNYLQNPAVVPEQGSVMPENAYRSLKVWCSNIPAAETVLDVQGRFYVTWDVIFKGLNNLI